MSNPPYNTFNDSNASPIYYSDVTDSQLPGRLAEWAEEHQKVEMSWESETPITEVKPSFTPATGSTLSPSVGNQSGSTLSPYDSYQGGGYAEPIETPPEDLDVDAIARQFGINVEEPAAKPPPSPEFEEPDVYECNGDEYGCCQYHIEEFEMDH